MKGKRSGKTNFVELEKLVSRLRLVAKDTHVAQRMMRRLCSIAWRVFDSKLIGCYGSAV